MDEKETRKLLKELYSKRWKEPLGKSLIGRICIALKEHADLLESAAARDAELAALKVRLDGVFEQLLAIPQDPVMLPEHFNPLSKARAELARILDGDPAKPVELAPDVPVDAESGSVATGIVKKLPCVNRCINVQTDTPRCGGSPEKPGRLIIGPGDYDPNFYAPPKTCECQGCPDCKPKCDNCGGSIKWDHFGGQCQQCMKPITRPIVRR